MQNILEKDFFLQPAEQVALGLLESDIVRRVSGEEMRLPVNEVEVYEGFEDRASHASRGKTERNKVMFEEGGIFYVYLVYGMHFMLNVVTGEKDYPAAILIRGAGPVVKVRHAAKGGKKAENKPNFYYGTGEYDGPGKLTKALRVDKSFDGKAIEKDSGLWFEKGETKEGVGVERLPRVGVDYAGEFWKNQPLRFLKVR